MAVYDDEQQKTGISDDELRKISGISPDEEGAMDREAHSGAASDTAKRAGLSGSELAEAESSGATASGSAADAKEAKAAGAADDTVGGGYKDEGGKKRFRGRITKKQAIGGGVATLLIGGGFGFMSIVQGPLQLTHMSKLLSGTFFSRNDATNDSSVRRVYNTISGQRERNNLAPLASALASRNISRLEVVGIEPKFETPNGKGRAKLQSIDVDPNTDEGKQLLGRARAEGFEVPAPGNNGKINLPMRGTDGGALARSLSDEMMQIDGKKGLAAKVSKRRLKKLFGVNFHPMNVTKRRGEDLSDRFRRRQNERGQEAKEGTQTGSTGDAVGTPDQEGTPGPVDGELDVGDDLEGQLNNITESPDLVERRSRLQTLRSSSFLRGAGAGAAIVGVMCAVKDMGNNVQSYRMANIIKPLIRLSMQFVTAGSQTQAMQDIDLEELRVFAEPLYDEQTQTSAFGAKPIKAGTGQDGGDDMDPSVKSQIKDAYSGTKPAFFSAIDAIPLLGSACTANNWFGDLPVLKQVGDVSNQVLGGLSSVATGKSIDEWMGDLIAVLSGDVIDVLASGSSLGNLLAYGGLLSGNASSIAMGGVPLDSAQAFEWKQYLDGQRRDELREKSIAERYLDPYSTDSVVGLALMDSAPYSSNLGSLSNVARGGFSIIGSSLGGSLTNIFSKPVAAQTTHGYNYGIPEFGIPVTQLNSTRYEDIYENIDRMEDNNYERLKAANAAWGQCFGNPLDDTGTIVDNEVTDEEYRHISDCDDDRANPDFQDYQMYILDNVSIKSMACYEGISDTACGEIGATNTTASSPSAATSANPGEDTSSQTCPVDPYIKDGGIAEKYGPGRILSHRIRLCIIKDDPGFDVNVSIAQNMANMVRSAEQAGVQLTPVASAYRTFDAQVGLRTSNGCPDTYFSSASTCRTPTARPGESNHEEGLAVDFAGIGKCPSRQGNRCVAPGNAKWNWLEANARQFGLNPLRSEAWHWSVTGG